MTTRKSYLFAIAFVLLAALPLRAQPPQKGADAPALQQRFHALLARARKQQAALPEARRTGPGKLAEAMLALRKANRAMSDKFLTQAAEALDALENPLKADVPRIGHQERAYISDIDGSPEPYLLYVPKGYDPKRKWPLLIFLHGYYAALNESNWKDFMYSPILEEICEREGVILLVPFARSNTEFMGIGESDVLRTIQYVRDEYRIDSKRIVISGASMGGSGAYSIACHYPQLFAAVMTITGRTDYYWWMKIKREALPRYKQVQVDTDYALELLPNVKHIPILSFHGQYDTEFARHSARLRELTQVHGITCEIVEHKNEGHYIWSKSFLHPSFIRMLREAVQEDALRNVTLRTFTLKYPQAFWVRVDEITRWGEIVEVKAEAAKDNTLVVQCRNVSSLTLGTGIPGIELERPVRITVNGKAVDAKTQSSGVFQIVLRPAPEEASNLRKTQALCGPIREAYDGPFIIVAPSQELPGVAQDRTNAARLAQEWRDYAQAAPNLLTDTQITKQHISRYNLILCGSPDTNIVLKRIAGKIPVGFAGGEYRVGARRFPSKNNGIQYIYPNPLNQKRYVLIVHGVVWGPKLQPNHKLDFLPDFIIYTNETISDGTWFPTNQFLCAGYFDGKWRLSEQSTWTSRGRVGVPPAGIAP